MRTILTRIFSSLLALATVVSVSAAPQAMMKKAGASNGTQVSLTTMKAQPASNAKKSLLDNAHRKTIKNTGAFSLRNAKAGSLKAPAKAPVKVPFRAADVPTNMIGNVVYSDLWQTNESGLYTVPTSATGSFDLIHPDITGSYGGVLVDGVYYAHDYYDYWGIFQIFTVTGYDIETGEEVFYFDGNPSHLAPGGITYDATTGTVYGITYTENADGYLFSKISYISGVVTVTPIAEIDEDFNCLAAASDGTVYGITMEGNLVKFNKADGSYTTVGSTGLYPYYLSSGAIDRNTDRFFWNVCAEDETGILAEVNLTTGAAEVLYSFTGNEEIMGLTFLAPAAEDKAPAELTSVDYTFTEGSLSGSVALTLPTTLFDGSAATGSLTYHVFANGTEVATGSAAAGASVTKAITLTTAGSYEFVAYCSNASGNGPKTKTTLFVGHGTLAKPVVTATYANGTVTLTWTTTSADGGYIDPAAITYYVTRLPDLVDIAENISATTVTDSNLPEPDGIVSYVYAVAAMYNGKPSPEGHSNPIVLGEIVPPYAPVFESDKDLEIWTVIDANDDGKVWTVQSDGSVRMTYNSSKDMDDWLITPPIKLEAGKDYELSFQAKSQSSSYPERLEVKYGKANTVAGMTATLIEPTDITSAAYEDYSAIITPDADGTYYIGFHGISDADQYYLYIANIALNSAGAPAEPTDLTVTPGADGALTATVAFKAPAVNLAGAATSLTKVELYRGETLINTFDAPAAGASLSYTDNLSAAGNYTYTVCAYNADGKGKPASATIWVGDGYPAAPTLVQLTEDTAQPGKVTVSWEPVTTTVDGGALSAGNVKYNLYLFGSNNDLIEVATNLTETSYTYVALTSGQDFLQYAVFAETARGEGDGAVSDMLAIGEPYDGMEESFANGTLSHILGITTLRDAAGQGEWSVATDSKFTDLQSADGDNGYILFTAQYLDYGSRLFTGKITLANLTNPAFTFYTYNIQAEEGVNDDLNTISVGVRPLGALSYTTVLPATAVNELSTEPGWTKVVVDLSAYKGQTIQICLDPMVKKYANLMFDSFKVGSLVDNDLKAASISAPAKANAGATFDVTVKVTNEGSLEATDYTVDLYANNEKVDTKTGEAVASGKSTSVTFTQEFSPIATEPVTYKAVVVYAADANLANNETAEVTVTPVVSKLPAVDDLAASLTADGVKLTWSEPDLTAAAPEMFTDDIEEATAWAHEYEGWTFIDGDKSAVGGFQNMDVPNITPGTTLASFFVWDQATSGGNQTFAAHSGDKYLAALFRYDDGTSDDWAISPVLYGGAQTISFYAMSYSDSYPEKIRVLYSTGSLNTADFVEALVVSKVPNTWTLYSVELPEGAQHFAINSCATGSFMLMVDDITYTPAGEAANLSLVGYDIYRNGEKINDTPVAECEYLDTTAPDGDNTYVVTVVYETGTSAASNEATVNTSGLSALTAGLSITTAPGTIIVTGAEDATVAVYGVDGKQLYNAAGNARVAVLPGVYVVKAADKVAKVLVK